MNEINRYGYRTCHEWAKKWGVSPNVAARHINGLLASGKMEAAQQHVGGCSWWEFRTALEVAS